MISSNEVSAVKPSARARVAARPGAHPDTMRMIVSIRLAADQRHRRITCDATQRLDLLPDGHADAPATDQVRSGPMKKAESIVATRIRKPTAERGEACQCRTRTTSTGNTASWPTSGSRRMLEKNRMPLRLACQDGCRWLAV